MPLSCQDGWTALHYAAAQGHHQIVTILLFHGSDINKHLNVSWYIFYNIGSVISMWICLFLGWWCCITCCCEGYHSCAIESWSEYRLTRCSKYSLVLLYVYDVMLWDPIEPMYTSVCSSEVWCLWNGITITQLWGHYQLIQWCKFPLFTLRYNWLMKMIWCDEGVVSTMQCVSCGNEDEEKEEKSQYLGNAIAASAPRDSEAYPWPTW